MRNDSNNLILDLQADMGITTVGAGISKWTDQTNRGNDLTQVTAGARPTLTGAVLNGKPTINFADTQYLSVVNKPDLAPPYVTMIVLAKFNADNATYNMLCGRGDILNYGYVIERIVASNKFGAYIGTGSSIGCLGNTWSNGSWRVIGITFDGIYGRSYESGLQVTPAASNGPIVYSGTGTDTFMVGHFGRLTAGRFALADVAAVRVWKYALTAPEMLIESRAIGGKWGISF